MPGDLGEGVARTPLCFLLPAAIPEGAAWEGAVLMEEAVDVRLDHGRAVPGPHVSDGLSHGDMHGQRVHAVDFPAGDAEARAARGQARLAGRLFHAGRYRVAVVLDEEAQRQLPRRGQVERFQRGADVGRAVTEVGNGDRAGPGVLVRPRRSEERRV